MHKIIVLYPHPNDPAAFEQYYRAVHLPLARKLPGMLDCRFTLSVNAEGGSSPYFAVFEADFADQVAMVAAITSSEGRAVQADVPNYATGGAIVLDYEVESVL